MDQLRMHFKYLREILTLVGEDRRKLPALVVLFLGVSLLDLAGLGLIAPYITLVMKPEALLEGRLGELLSSLWGAIDRETLLLGLEWTAGGSLSRQGDRGPGHQQRHHPLCAESTDPPAHPPDARLSAPALPGLPAAQLRRVRSLGAKLDRSVSRCLATAVAHTQQRARRLGHSRLAPLGKCHGAGIAGGAGWQHTLRL